MKSLQIAAWILSITAGLCVVDDCRLSEAQQNTSPARDPAAAPQPASAAGPVASQGRGASVTITPPADAVTVEKVPPLDRIGNFKVTPTEPWTNGVLPAGMYFLECWRRTW